MFFSNFIDLSRFKHFISTITRQSLQAFDNDKEQNELKEEEFQKKFAQLLEE